MKITYIYFSLCLFSLLSCNDNTTTNKSIKLVEDNIQFNIPFGAWPYYYEENGKEWLGFAEFSSRKKITVTDINGNIENIITLEPVIDSVKSKFSEMSFFSKDTIALLSMYTNKVIMLDRNSRIVNKKNYSYLLKNGNELFKSMKFRNRKLFCGLTSIDTIEYNGNNSLKPSNKMNHSAPHFLYDPMPLNDTKPNQIIHNFYSRFAKENNMTIEGNYFEINDSLFIVHSCYSDTLYIYNFAGNLKRSIKVHSDNLRTKISPVTFQDNINNEGLFHKNTKQSSFIFDLLWDKYKNIYYCIIRGKYDEQKDSYPFNIIVYDQNFNKLNETVMNDNLYLSFFVGKKGLYIKHNHFGNMKVQNYSIFRYE